MFGLVKIPKAINVLEFSNCYDDNTYKLNETIVEAYHHVEKMNDVLKNTSNWIMNKGNVFLGQCHTFQYPHNLQADAVSDGILFTLHTSLSYRVLIHDPKYYLLVTQPKIFPRIYFQLKVFDS